MQACNPAEVQAQIWTHCRVLCQPLGSWPHAMATHSTILLTLHPHPSDRRPQFSLHRALAPHTASV